MTQPTDEIGRTEAARILGVHGNTVTSYRERGWLTATRVLPAPAPRTGNVRYSRTEVEALRDRMVGDAGDLTGGES